MDGSDSRLRELERLRPILETALDAVVVMDPGGAVADWNRAAEGMFGWTREEAVGRPMNDLIVPPHHRAAHAEGIERFNRTGEARVLNQRLEITALRRSGEEFPVELSITQGGSPEHRLFVGFLRDIGDRYLSQRLLARQAREAQLLFQVSRIAAETDSVPEVIGQTLRTICELTDWPVGHAFLVDPETPDRLVSSEIWHGGDTEDLAALRAGTLAICFTKGTGLAGSILETREPAWVVDIDRDANFIRKGLGYASAFGFPVNVSGEVRAVLEFFSRETAPPDEDLLLTVRTVGDQVGRVLERAAAIAELRRLNESLEQRVDERSSELMEAQDQLRQAQKMEAIGQLTGGVAHDFNNLLTIIRSSADLLRRDAVPEERKRQYLDAIADTADRAAKLTAQLLAFARRQALKPEIFDAAERVRLVCDMIRTVVGSRVRMELDIECDNCSILADIAQFETALINIAVNARDAMNGEGTLAISASAISGIPAGQWREETPGEYVAVSVRDSGAGMKNELLNQIFEPFFTTKDVGKGTGLGLSQVYGFVKQSGGDVDVRSEPGQGTIFTLFLPRVEPEELPERPERSERSEAAPERTRILVVEDNSHVGDFAQRMLEEVGHEAVHVGSGAEALELLEQDPGAFDLVFTDVVMAGMSGIELGKEIRKRWPQQRVVLTSGYSDVLAHQGRHGFELLQKPYSLGSLSRIIRGGAGPDE